MLRDSPVRCFPRGEVQQRPDPASRFPAMFEALQNVLAEENRVAYAIAFGSAARGSAGAHSDLDLALGLAGDARLTAREVGSLAARLEAAAGVPVDLVLLDEAPPGLAYRVFRDGRLILARDPSALVARKARAILEYLDFQPIEELLARGALGAAARGR